MCQTYHSLVKAVAGIRGILDKPAARHMFGVSITKSGDGIQEESISVKYPSFSHTVLTERALVPVNAAKRAITVALPKLELAGLIRQALLARLNQVISDIDFLARKSRAFQLCASYLTTGRCSEQVDDAGDDAGNGAGNGTGNDVGDNMGNHNSDDKTQARCWRDHLPEADSASTIRTFNSQFRLHIVMISLLSRYTAPGKEGARIRAQKQR